MSTTPQKASKRSRQSSRSLDSAAATPPRSPALQPSSTLPPHPPPPHHHQPQPRSSSSSLQRSASQPPSAAPADSNCARKQKKSKKEKAEAAKLRAAATGNGGGGGSCTHTTTSAAAAAAAALAQSRLLLQSLSAVEVQFQLEQDRNPRTTLTPRDIANLILWSVPAPVPLIESPRIFFVKNKSRMRNFVVIYVNGWSYDELLCTGVGLPRPASAAAAAAAATTTTDSSNNNNGVSCGVDSGSVQWDKALCSAMLSPVRESRCWARPGRGSGCAGGVQYSPLTIPSVKNELEKDLWWRNDAPRRPGGASPSPSSTTASAAAHGTGAATTNTAEVHAVDADASTKHGTGALFRRALQSHNEEATATKAATGGGGDVAADVAAAPQASILDNSSNPFFVHRELWRDRALLTQYALKLPTHAVTLTELGFALSPPLLPRRAHPDSATGDAAEEDGTPASVEQQGWRSFDEPAAVTVAAAAAHSNSSKLDQDGAPSLSAAPPPPRVVALDCEMVLVEGGESALARATLVDVHTGLVVLDILVKPQERVIDYLTRFSGIDQAMLDPVSTTLADCQARMKACIDTATFVVGHSLENDFKACRFVPNCLVLDTAWLFPHPAGLPYKNALRFLALRYLNRRIQQGSHDSAIDALVSAELVQLKLVHGPTFGIRPRVSVLSLITAAAGEAEAPAATAETSTAPTAVPATPSRAAAAVRAHPRALDVQVRLYDDPVTLTAILPGGAAAGRIDAVPVRHDEDATRKIVRALQRRSAQQQQAQVQEGVQATLSGAEEDEVAEAPPSFGLYWVQLSQTKVDVVLPPPPPAAARDSEKSSAAPVSPQAYAAAQYQVVHDTNRRVLRVIEACPDETLVVVMAGRCAGEAGGNHFSRAQGTCFAFVKDSSATGPRADEMARRLVGEEEEQQHGAAQTPHHPTDAPQLPGTPSAAEGVTASAVLGATPPACQQQ